ncbi:MAG: GtrA family protein [Pseudomonadota bacterium]
MKHSSPKSFLRYLVVGAAGFVTEAVMVASLIVLGATPVLARIVSFPTALLVTWLLNRSWSFRATRHQRIASELLAYVGVQIAGFLVNLATYFVIVRWLEQPGPVLAVFALAIASGVGLIVNYLGAKSWVFRA